MTTAPLLPLAFDSEEVDARSAIISDCGRYRYTLRRVWDETLPTLVVCMLNSSTADHEKNDPTISRLIGFVKRWGYGSFTVVNLCAFRSPNPKALLAAADPVGPENDRYFAEAVASGHRVLCAWGAWGKHPKIVGHRNAVVRLLLDMGVQPYVFRLGENGEPVHPLARGKHRLPDDIRPIEWEVLAC